MGGVLMGRLFMEREELRRHMKKIADEIPEHQLGEYYTQRVVQKYSKEDQDAFLAEVINTIMNVPGGYWQIVDNMAYMPEFEHYAHKGVVSYEKGNVPKTVAIRELTVETYRKLYK